MHWYKRDPNAFLSGTLFLTLEECGAYSKIIDHYYACDGKILDDDYRISRVMNCNPRTWRRLKMALFQKQKLSVCDGFLTPNRGEYTLNEARTMSERQANRSRMRWERDKNANDINGHPMQSGNPITTTTTPTPIKKEKKDSRAVGARVNFLLFWNAYPRKEGIKAAEKAFDKAIKETTIDVMLAALTKQRPKWKDPQYIPHPATWLNQGRWADEPGRLFDEFRNW